MPKRRRIVFANPQSLAEEERIKRLLATGSLNRNDIAFAAPKSLAEEQRIKRILEEDDED